MESEIFRLLASGEIVMSSDEFIDDDCQHWLPAERWTVGRPWHNGLKPMRRAVKTMRVVIDGVDYVPSAAIPPLEDARMLKAIQSLTEIQYFSDCSHKHRAWAWDALNALAPDLAKLAADNPQAAYNRVHPE